MKKIIVVDDQAEVRELVEVTLRSAEYEIYQAESGERAIELAEQNTPDLILMDVMMPGGIDGLEAVRRIKAGSNGCKVIMLTARGSDSDVDRGRSLGVDAYLVKPFSPLELLANVEDVLGTDAARS